MAWTLELLLGLQPVRCAAQVGTNRRKNEEAIQGPDNPDPACLVALVDDTLTRSREITRIANLEFCSRLEGVIGKQEANTHAEAGNAGSGEEGPARTYRGEERTPALVVSLTHVSLSSNCSSSVRALSFTARLRSVFFSRSTSLYSEPRSL